MLRSAALSGSNPKAPALPGDTYFSILTKGQAAMTKKGKRLHPLAPPGPPEGSYKLDEHDQFTVPYGGTFKLNSKERCVELVSSRASIAVEMVTHALYPDIAAEMLKHALGPKALREAMRPDEYGVVKQFKNMETLHAYVPKIAELSRNMLNLGERKPRFVFGVGANDHKDAELKSNVESALRGHGVDAHVVMMSKATGGGKP